jgi:hypothetical protein
MRTAGLLLTLAAIAVCVACGGGGSKGPTAVVSPIGTKAGTPTPTPVATVAPGGNGAPDPIEPTLDEALTEIASGHLTADVQPGGTYNIDPQSLATSLPSCTNFEFDFTWQVTDPYPADGVDLKWQIQRNGSPVKIAEAASGEQSVGCDSLQALNAGSAPISVAIKYKIGGLPQ